MAFTASFDSQLHNQLKLNSGRVIRLYSLRQSIAYSFLEGGPDQRWNDQFIQEWLEVAQRSCNPGSKPFVIPPDRRTRSEDEEYNAYLVSMGSSPKEYLPIIACIAHFKSLATNRIKEEDRPLYVSWLTVHWYQDDFGLPTDLKILEAMRAIDWDAWATDQEF